MHKCIISKGISGGERYTKQRNNNTDNLENLHVKCTLYVTVKYVCIFYMFIIHLFVNQISLFARLGTFFL